MRNFSLAICVSGWAKLAMSDVGLGSMNSHSPGAIKGKEAKCFVPKQAPHVEKIRDRQNE